MDKVKIGDNEYRLPIWCTTTKILSPFTETSPNMSERNFVTNEDITTALNELTQLRAERDALKARVEEFGAVFDTWWEQYSTQSGDKKQDGWGWIDEAWSNLKQRNTTPGGDE